MLGTSVARAHGLSLDAEPWIMADSAERLTGAGAYVVVAGAVDGEGQHALESATVVLDGTHQTILHPCRPDHGVAIGGPRATQPSKTGASN